VLKLNRNEPTERLSGYEVQEYWNQSIRTDEAFVERIYPRTPQHETQQSHPVSRIPSVSGLISCSGPSREAQKSLERKNPSETRGLSPISRERLQSHPGSSYDISEIFLVDGPRPDYPYQVHFDASQYGVVNVQVGDPTTEPLHHLPIDVSRRNAELLHFCR
jgi:hypothetical protein